jgi:hypothetical protein
MIAGERRRPAQSSSGTDFMTSSLETRIWRLHRLALSRVGRFLVQSLKADVPGGLKAGRRACGFTRTRKRLLCVKSFAEGLMIATAS